MILIIKAVALARSSFYRSYFAVQSWRRFIYFLFPNGFLTSGDIYYAGKPLESAVCFFDRENKINLNFLWVYGCDQRLLFEQSRRSKYLDYFIELDDNNLKLLRSNIS